MRLYVGNLAYSTTDDGLRTRFSEFGRVSSAVVVIDKMSGRSRGFGFVEFATPEEAQKAMQAMNGADVDGRALVVNAAREREAEGGGGGAGPGLGRRGFATVPDGGHGHGHGHGNHGHGSHGSHGHGHNRADEEGGGSRAHGGGRRSHGGGRGR